MAEIGRSSVTPAPSPPAAAPGQALSASDRRKLQNRIAQRRFRKKKAFEQNLKLVELAESQAPASDRYECAFLATPPEIPPLPSTATYFQTDRAAQFAEQAGSTLLELSQRNPGQIGEPADVATWETQLWSDMFYLGGGASTNIPAPSTSPSLSTPLTSSEPTRPSSDTSSPSGETSGRQDSTDQDTFLQRMLLETSGATSTSLANTNQSEEMRVHLRMKAAIEWKGKRHPKPTWSQEDDEPQEPLLHTAAKKGNCEIIQMLLEHNADIDKRDARGCTALHLAIEQQQCEAILFLLQKGIDINAIDDEGRTALSMAVNNNCELSVKLFLCHGADPQLCTSRPRQNTARRQAPDGRELTSPLH